MMTKALGFDLHARHAKNSTGYGDVCVGVIINDLINTVKMSTVNVVKSEPTKYVTVSHDGNEW